MVVNETKPEELNELPTLGTNVTTPQTIFVYGWTYKYWNQPTNLRLDDTSTHSSELVGNVTKCLELS